MKFGYIKTASVTPKIRVADTAYNRKVICEKIDEAMEEGAVVIVFPELCITGYSCGDLFWQETLLEQAKRELFKIAEHTEGSNGIVFVGLPLKYKSKLYNVAAAISNGEVLGFVPKSSMPNYNEFYEARYFSSGMQETIDVEISAEEYISMGTNMLFTTEAMPDLKIAVEICEDLWVPMPPSINHVRAGANLIVNLSASNEVAGKENYRRTLIAGHSGRLICGYVYASAGDGESTQDVVFSGHNIIAENGKVLAEAQLFKNETIYAEIDIQRLNGERRRKNTFDTEEELSYEDVEFELERTRTKLTREISPSPFVPRNPELLKNRCKDILMIQAMGLKKRLEHTNCKCAVVGISGGLDSTLALLVTVQAFDLLGLERSGIYGVTMPGFGTTDRTYDNAVQMIKSVGATFFEISIKEAVKVHFRDIGHDENVHDVTYENSQARERTQILMDVANKYNGMVIGTGDMSELALGWATYNGDHMSMYGVNSSVPKTLVRHLVQYYAENCAEKELSEILFDVLDTPVSPELLPPTDGEISQKTEDIVGPYELHDFYMYYILRCGFTPRKIFYLAQHAFAGVYDRETILKWMKIFYRRFFSQQFKRSCLPDGPKVGNISVSPRGDLRMPSDACARIWLEELDRIR